MCCDIIVYAITADSVKPFNLTRQILYQKSKKIGNDVLFFVCLFVCFFYKSEITRWSLLSFIVRTLLFRRSWRRHRSYCSSRRLTMRVSAPSTSMSAQRYVSNHQSHSQTSSSHSQTSTQILFHSHFSSWSEVWEEYLGSHCINQLRSYHHILNIYSLETQLCCAQQS